MSQPLINILIRNKYRPEELLRCLNSIEEQTYSKDNINVIILSDTDRAFDDTIAYGVVSTIINYSLIKSNGVTENHYWNLYCNRLKVLVESGWFFFLDNDDYLASPTVLEELSHHLFEGALIVQFMRGNKIKKPTDRMIHDKVIKKGVIGGGCLVLHHSFKDVADWDDQLAADYRWIKAVTDKVQTRFVPIVLQIAPNNGRHGK